MNLTPADLDLIAHFIADRTPRQIAAARKISTTATLDATLRLYRKLDVTDRPRAIAVAARLTAESAVRDA